MRHRSFADGFADSDAVLVQLRRFPDQFSALLIPHVTNGRICPKMRMRGQVVRRHRQHKHLIDTLETAHHHLAQAIHCLGPAEALLNQLALVLRDRLAGCDSNGMGTAERRHRCWTRACHCCGSGL